MVPLTSFTLKVAGRCNINCSYCFMYKLADQSWRRQPTAMSPPVWQAAARRIRDHLARHPLPQAHITVHGGEPLLLGKAAMAQLLSDFQETLDDLETEILYFVQTNGTLLDQEWVELFARFGVILGVSLDGTAATHDAHRVDHLGRGTYAVARRAIALLRASAAGREIFAGVYSVINTASDPAAELDHMLALGVPAWIVQPPDASYACLPPGKERLDLAPYGEWLVGLWDAYQQRGVGQIYIQPFESLAQRIQANAEPELDDFDGYLGIMIVEANGEFHAADLFKVARETALGLNVFEHSVDEAYKTDLFSLQVEGKRGLPQQCGVCPILSVCQGGDKGHRFSPTDGYNNPSLYCADLYRLITHMQQSRALAPNPLSHGG